MKANVKIVPSIDIDHKTGRVIGDPVKCAIYGRTSTDERLDSAFNSLDAQELMGTKYIDMHQHEGLVLAGVYMDGGYSGGNMKRPDLKRLIADIKARKINMVIVYKIDRLSRSLLDFLNLMRLLEEHDVAFVSVTQHINTATAAGKLMINVMMSFGEYEREISRDRVRDKMSASKEKGLWTGGYVPLGYDAKEKQLIVNENQAQTVRFIFGEFIKQKSIHKLTRFLRANEIKNKNGKIGGYFSTASLRVLLNNPTYIGKVRHKEALYDGQQEAIVSDDIWQASRKIINVNPRTRSGVTKRKVPFVLMGLLKCGCCNSSMVPSYTKNRHGKLYRYYVSHAHAKAKCVDCQIKQISAPEIESLVFDKLYQMFQTPDVLVETWKQANHGNQCNQASQANSANKDSEYGACGTMSDVTVPDVTISEEQVRDALVNINSIWGNLFPVEQQRVVNLMVEKVVMQTDSVKLQLKDDGLLNFVQNGIERINNVNNTIQ